MRMILSNLILATPAFWAVSAHAQVLDYPLSGNLRAAEGTIEFWFRLEDEPEQSQSRGLHYFPLFHVTFEGEERPRINFSYQTIWTTNHFHFWLSSSGRLMGKLIGNPYITSVEDTQQVVKADTYNFKYPRTPRMHKGEWHHFAFAWRGVDETTVALFIDGKPSIMPKKLQTSLWADVEGATLSLLGYVHHDNYTIDDFRISSIARTEAEVAETFARGKLALDKYTLLFDRFENVIEGEATIPDIMAASDPESRQVKILAKYVVLRCFQWVDGWGNQVA